MPQLLAASDNTVGIAVISMAFIVLGYGLVGALFYWMVYKPSRKKKRAERHAAEDGPPTISPDADKGRNPQGARGRNRP
jgi:hypothetical protein